MDRARFLSWQLGGGKKLKNRNQAEHPNPSAAAGAFTFSLTYLTYDLCLSIVCLYLQEWDLHREIEMYKENHGSGGRSCLVPERKSRKSTPLYVPFIQALPRSVDF